MPVKVKTSTVLPWLVYDKALLKLSCIITGKLLKLSDNVFDQFIGVRIISIVQRYHH